MHVRNWRRASFIALGIFGAAAVHAASYNISSVGLDPTPGGLEGNIFGPGLSASGEYAGVGRIVLNGTNTATNAVVSLQTYCVDIADILHSGLFSTSDWSASAVSWYTQAKLDTLTNFLTHANALVDVQPIGATYDGKTASAAAQLGAWEIMNESSANSYNVATGAFYASGGNLGGTSSGAIQLANTWLGYLGTTWTAPVSNNSLTLLTSPNNQEQTLITIGGNSAPPPSSVPEPGTWLMAMAGFGLIGNGLRRRRVSAIG